MKRIVIMLCAFSVCVLLCVPLRASAHNAKPAGTFCFADQCDSVLLHATDGGSNCSASLTNKQTIPIIDKDGRTEVTLHLYESNTCHTYYATAFTDTTYAGTILITGLRKQDVSGDTDDPNNYSTFYTWPNYCQSCWLDQGMVGFDNASAESNGVDCFMLYNYQVQDRYGTYHDGNGSTFCSG